MPRWTDAKNLRKGSRMETRDGIVTLTSDPKKTTTKKNGKDAPVVSLSGERNGQEYKGYVADGSKVKKV